MPSYPIYDGPTSFTADTTGTTFPTSGKLLESNLTINPPDFTKEVNESGGYTVTIGGA